MTEAYVIADLSSRCSSPLRIAYYDTKAPNDSWTAGTILFLHGFPQTSYQFRHVLPLFAREGYRCIAPDYRGAGLSSKADSGYDKVNMAEDMFALLDYLGIHEPVHVVGHDIGGMIAFAMATRKPERVRSVCWGECHLPGSRAYEEDRTVPARTLRQFHFVFHSVADLPEALVAGRESIYVEHFLRKMTYNLTAFSESDIAFYAHAYSQPGSMRCAMNVYRAFEDDAKANKDWIAKHGSCKVRTLILSDVRGWHREGAEKMSLEVTEAGLVEAGVVEDADHYLAEENPNGFCDVVVAFLREH